ncbi:MAG TPA: dihydroorotase family protein [Stellaceae bacterium]|nr:dihydroorotase family protein [Stellaceae bacterium]
MASLCIHNAKVVTGTIASGGVLIEDGRIAACLHGNDRASADVVIDARSRLLFPGFVDAHVHMRDPGQPQKEDFGSGSAAAAVGGITTVMCMPNTRPPIDSQSGFDHARKAGESRSFVDFALQAAVHPSNQQAMASLWDEGVVSFETMLADGPAGEAYVDAARLLDMLAQAAALGTRVGVFAGNQPVIDAALDRLRKAGRTDFPAFAESRPAISESLGLVQLIEARHATGAHVIARQVSTARGFEIVAAAKAQAPASVLIEVTPHHLHLDATALAQLGPFAQMLPPLRSKADVAAAQAAAASGVVDFVGSDHAPHALAEKDTADPWSCPSGTPGLDTLAPAVLDLAAGGIIAYAQVALLLAERPAQAFGLGDRKGRIAVGLDADLALVDPEATFRVTPEVIRSRAGRSPFEGLILRGRPVLTVLRGEVIAEDGKIAVDRPRGRLLRRARAS